MADHDVKLNYDKSGVKPDPDPITVQKGHTISFKLGTGGPPEAKVRITFRDASSFSTPHFEEGDSDVKVVADLAAPTTYDCDLIIGGKALPRPEGAAGGGIKPGRASS